MIFFVLLLICSGADRAFLIRGASGRFAVVGATLHGPFFLYTFGLMDKLPLSSVKSNLGKALAKTLVTQFTIYPLFIVLFYGYIGLLEGVPLNQLIEAKKAPAMDTMLHGLVFWPIANTVRKRRRRIRSCVFDFSQLSKGELWFSSVCISGLLCCWYGGCLEHVS